MCQKHEIGFFSILSICPFLQLIIVAGVIRVIRSLDALMGYSITPAVVRSGTKEMDWRLAKVKLSYRDVKNVAKNVFFESTILIINFTIGLFGS